MSTIRTLIDAHRAALDDFAKSEDAPEPRTEATKAEWSIFNALVKEPARSLDAMHAKAAYLLEGEDHVAFLCGNPDLLRAMLSSFVRPDPAIAAIRAHRAARDRVMDLDDTDPDWPAAMNAEGEAWRELVATKPTTFAGVRNFADYVAAQPDLDALTGRDGLAQALRSIAFAFNTMDWLR